MKFLYESNRIFAEKDGKIVAEILFPVNDGTAVITRTFVDGSLRGQGVAGQLVNLAVQQIRANGWEVKATCSYASKWLENHSEF